MEEVQKNTEGQLDSMPEQDDSGSDYKSLYLAEVQNAKKLRKRAQENESLIEKFHKTQEEEKNTQLLEQQKFQELSENLQRQLDEATPYKQKWEDYESQTREELLSQLPEDDRESLKTESLKTLKYIVKKLDSKTSNPQATVGAVRNVTIDKPYAEMTEAERKQWHQDTMKGNR
tara:strand:- start:1535 stop:2056 length:522 start_codon:yes stop_codon:yes gene_type:complete